MSFRAQCEPECERLAWCSGRHLALPIGFSRQKQQLSGWTMFNHNAISGETMV
jgi:hypothetical protein